MLDVRTAPPALPTSGALALLVSEGATQDGVWKAADAAIDALRVAAFAAAPPAPYRAKMVVVPHAGIDYSGRIAASALSALDAPERLKRVVILGPNHRVALDGIALHPAHAWATPLGVAPVAEDAARAILSLDGVAVDAQGRVLVADGANDRIVVFAP